MGCKRMGLFVNVLALCVRHQLLEENQAEFRYDQLNLRYPGCNFSFGMHELECPIRSPDQDPVSIKIQETLFLV